MKAWIERVIPAGERIELPQGSAVLVFGRSRPATIVFDDAKLAARHCELAFDEGFWRIRDLGTDFGTQVNGVEVEHPRALFRGDVISIGGVRLRFDDDLPGDDPLLLQAIAQSPDREDVWLVYADSLQEAGDPLGARIIESRSGALSDHQPWLGPLWGHFLKGELEIEWRFGCVRRATLRQGLGRLAYDWRDVVATLLNLRVGRFLRELIIDVPRLEGAAPRETAPALERAQRFLATLPNLPTTLGRLLLGYHVGDPLGDAPLASPALRERLPHLSPEPVYAQGTEVTLRLASAHPSVRVGGLQGGRKAIPGIVRVRRVGRAALELEAPPMPFFGDGNPCYFSANSQRLDLVAGRLHGEIRVNGRSEKTYALLPGDTIEVQALCRFVVELAS